MDEVVECYEEGIDMIWIFCINYFFNFLIIVVVRVFGDVLC